MTVDGFILNPTYEATRSITVAAAPEHLWPWLVQMGYRRGGLYSYDWLDRLFGFLDRPSANEVLPECQSLSVGDVIPVGRGQGFPVVSLDPYRSLVMAGEQDGFAWGWELALEPIGPGRTRLVSRNLARVPRTIGSTVFMLGLRPAAFIMTRRMLIGLKRRAEALAARPRADRGRAPWLWRSVRATRGEKALSLPGDELIPDPIGSLMHAITIARPPEDVWLWLAQMGADRAGWYSYDRLDNGGRRSAWRIKPELQAPIDGTVFPALPGVRDGFTLVSHQTNRFLILSWRQPTGQLVMTWSFVLTPIGQSATRLLVRARGSSGYRFLGLPEWLSMLVIRPVHFLMERKQLVGIARRAERTSPDELLDRFMPEFDVVERHEVRVAAPLEVTFKAVCDVRLSESKLVRTIVRARELFMGARLDRLDRPPELLEGSKKMGWGVLAELPGREVVMGAVTKPWEADVTFHPLAPAAFAAFHEPGYVKIAWTLRADPAEGQSIARTETRAVATDPASRARFKRYWRRVVPGVLLIRHVAMALVKRDAEGRANAAMRTAA